MLSMLFTVSENNFPLALDPLPCSVLILSMAKNQSDVENLVKNCLNLVYILKWKLYVFYNLVLIFVFYFVFASALQVKKYDGIVFNPLSPKGFPFYVQMH